MSRLPLMTSPRVWEPSAGTGEFVSDVLEKYPDASVVASEIDPVLCDVQRRRFGSHPNVEVRHEDALLAAEAEYDLIVGNPPYFEMRDLCGDLRAMYDEVISGRPNIYCLFLKKCLDSLSDGGRLAFVLPPSMNSGRYFQRLREYVRASASIEFLKVYDSNHFEGANQSVMVLILRKGGSGDSYVFARNGLLLFSEHAAAIETALRDQWCLESLGFSVKTGGVVWNERRDALTDDSSQVFLVWSHNIGECGELIASAKKPQYICGDGLEVLSGPAVLINRIVGKVGSGRLRAACVGDGFSFVAENHVNVITHKEVRDLGVYGRLCSHLRSSETSGLIRCITGNTQVSKTEIEKLVPIPRSVIDADWRGQALQFPEGCGGQGCKPLEELVD